MTGASLLRHFLLFLIGIIIVQSSTLNFASFPHESDRSLYYINFSDEKILFSCPERHYFDDRLAKCIIENPFYVMCPETPTCMPEDWGYSKPYPPDCSKYIYCKDQFGSYAIRSCPKLFHYSPDNSKCMPIITANCPSCSITTPEPSTTTTVSTATELPTTSTIKQCPEIPTCTANDIGLLLPYPPDCQRYIYCDGVGPGELSICPSDLYFSAELMGCVTEQEANCSPCVDIETTATSTTVTSTIGICPETPTCEIGDIGMNKPYPPNCQFYIYCGDEGEELSTCPIGQHFSALEMECLPKDVANCPKCEILSSTTEITSTTASTTTESTTPITTTTESTTTESTTPSTTTTEILETTKTTLPVCPQSQECGVNDEGMTYPYPPDCTMFIYCGPNGDEQISSCPSGLHFSAIDSWCVAPEDANCPLCVTTTVGDSTSTTPITSTTIGSTSTTIIESTTTEITSTDSTTVTSTLPVCQATPECGIQDEGKNLPYPQDCTMFIYCEANGVEVPSSCPSGQHFSPTEYWCMSPEEANCPLCVLTTEDLTTATSSSILPTTEEITTVSTSESTTEIVTLPECQPSQRCTPEIEGSNLPYPPDCTMFIYCAEYSVEELSFCPPGLHFSPTEFWCVEPEYAGCPTCVTTTVAPNTTTKKTTPTEPITDTTTISTTLGICQPPKNCGPMDIGSVLPYPQNCSLFVYCGADGDADLSFCPAGQEFSPEELACMDSESANCPYCITTTEIYTETTTISQSSTLVSSTIESTSTSSTTEVTTIPPCAAAEKCSSADLGFTKPYPPDCRKYIYCSSVGDGSIRTCSTGNEFSPVLLKCTTPEIANCPFCIVTTTTVLVETTSTTEITLTTTETTYNTDSTTDAVITSTTEITTEYTTIPPCPANESCSSTEIGYNKPYPPDCTKYVYCAAEGLGKLRVCSIGFHFSPHLSICTTPEIALCPLCLITTTTVTIPTESTTTTVSVCQETPTCTIEEEGTLKPYPPDCTAFLYCNEFGQAELSYCAPGLHYNNDLQVCTSPETANCLYCIELTSTTDQSSSTSSTTSEPLTYTTTTESISTTVTTTEIESTESTTTEIIISSTYTSDSTTEIISTTIQPTTLPVCPEVPTCSIGELGLKKPYPNNCTIYIYCDTSSGGPGKIRKCLLNLHFNPETSTCMKPELANCPLCEPATTITEEITTTTPETSTTTESTTTTTETTITTTDTTATTIAVCPEIPTCSIEGSLLPYPPDCNKFIYCDAGNVAELSSCPYDWHFNSTLERCMAQELANCPYCIVTTTYAPTTTLPPKCPEPESCLSYVDGTLLSYPEDCSKYIYCYNGIGEISDCPVGFHFNSQATPSSCMEPELANCPKCSLQANSELKSNVNHSKNSFWNIFQWW